MRGLFEKDVRLAAQRKRALLIFIVIMVIMGMSTDGLFIVSYGTLIFGIFAAGTMSYDDFDNCLSFLLTLPITKKDYVKEKFLFCLSGVVMGWIVSFVICGALSAYKGVLDGMLNQLGEEFVALPLFMAVIAIMIPIQIKYDAEKSRIVLLVLGGAVFALFALGKKVFGEASSAMVQSLNSIPEAIIMAGLIAICLLILVCMYIWSVSIVEKKEF